MSIFSTEMSRSIVPCYIDTALCFDVSHTNSINSPIDRFFKTERDFSRFCTPELVNDIAIVGGLTLLGSFSAVESFLREIIREIVSIDKISQKFCENQSLTYGAARVHNVQMMPEAILEQYSFVSESSIKNALKDMLGVKGDAYPRNIKDQFEKFSKICQLRHCVVHRGGRLGTRNAIALDLDRHKRCIEKPLKLAYADVQNILQSNNNLVIGLNNFLFGFLLTRYVGRSDAWKWDFRKDKTRFQNFFTLFHSQMWSPEPDKNMKETYDQFRNEFKN